jgi:hypothetical protein
MLTWLLLDETVQSLRRVVNACVTPFSSDLPVMERVEIVDAAVAYDDRYTRVTYILLMRNVLWIPLMDHNLLPPFLIREASLYLDETPKFQSNDLSLDNHCIYDEVSGLRIHLQLKGTFSYFATRALTDDEQANWENYHIVHLTPDSDSWNPHSLHFAEAEASMMDCNGEIVGSKKRNRTIFDEVEVDVSEMYSDPWTWDNFQRLVDDQLDACDSIAPLSDDNVAMMEDDGIRAQVARVRVRVRVRRVFPGNFRMLKILVQILHTWKFGGTDSEG